MIVDWSVLNNAFIYISMMKTINRHQQKHKTCLVIKKKPTLKSSVILITNTNELQCPWPSKIHIISEHNHYAVIFIYFKTLFLKTKALKYQEIITFRMRFLKKNSIKNAQIDFSLTHADDQICIHLTHPLSLSEGIIQKTLTP